jgi:hypothetical protein
MTENEQEILLMTVDDRYNLFLLAIHQQLLERFSKTISF